MAGIGQIKARIDVIEENILSLSERTQQIDAIIDTFNVWYGRTVARGNGQRAELSGDRTGYRGRSHSAWAG
jgi:hypothetical protein